MAKIKVKTKETYKIALTEGEFRGLYFLINHGIEVGTIDRLNLRGLADSLNPIDVRNSKAPSFITLAQTR